jgi:acetyl esterase/lipase
MRLLLVALLSALLGALPAQAAMVNLYCPPDVLYCNTRFALGTISVSTVQYGSAPNLLTGTTQQLLFDVYRSSGVAGQVLPVVVLVHGGAFLPSSVKNDTKFQQEAASYAMRGFLAISIEYRRYGDFLGQIPEKVLHPAADTLTAVRYIIANAGSLLADPKRIAVYGCSAGAVTVSYAFATEFGDNPPPVSAVIAGSGGLLLQLTLPLRPCAVVPPMLFVDAFDDPIAKSLMNGTRVPSTMDALSEIGVPVQAVLLGGPHCALYNSTLGDAGQNIIFNTVNWMLRFMNISSAHILDTPVWNFTGEWCPAPKAPCPNATCPNATCPRCPNTTCAACPTCADGATCPTCAECPPEATPTVCAECPPEATPTVCPEPGPDECPDPESPPPPEPCPEPESPPPPEPCPTLGGGEPNPALLFAAFKSVFPVRDGSTILAQEDVFSREAREHLDLLGVPHSAAAFCAETEEADVLKVLMKASLGNIVGTPFQANPVSGKLEAVDTYETNRVAVFQVLVFALLLALARSWFLLEQPVTGLKQH